MKTLKLLFAAVIGALCIGTASAQLQSVYPQTIGPFNAYSSVCNGQTGPAYGAACALYQEPPGAALATFGAGTGACLTAPSSILGGTTAGSFVCLGTAGASTLIVNLPAAPHGWVCGGSDSVTGANVTSETVVAGSAKLIFTSTTNTDVIAWSCRGY